MSLAWFSLGFGRTAAMRRDLKRVERELARIDEPELEAPDLIPIWEELAAMLRATGAGPDDAEVPVLVDRYVDTYVADFMRSVDERRDARLGALDRLELKVDPHLARIRTVMRDELLRLGLLDTIINDLLGRVAVPETPLVLTTDRPDPKEQHR